MEDESTLVLVLDVSVTSWGKTVVGLGKDGAGAPHATGSGSQLHLSDYVEHLHAFINAFLLINKQNAVGLVAMSDRRSHSLPLLSLGQRCLYASARNKAEEEEEEGMTKTQRDKSKSRSSSSRLGRREAILEELKEGISEILQARATRQRVQEAQQEEEQPSGSPSGVVGDGDMVALSSSYSRALCILRRHQEQYEDLHGDPDLHFGRKGRRQRILFLPQGAKDVSSQYVQVMNASFCAQKMNVVVDTFMVGASDSSFLQQAASLTGGIYANFFSDVLEVPKFSLSTYLIHIFLPDPETRQSLQLPKGHTSTNLKVSCFLTNKPLDVGFVCSVCLSIFSTKLKTCAVCGTLFANTKTLKKKVINRSN
jgi:transcription initiation factor TFIIH subunit 3